MLRRTLFVCAAGLAGIASQGCHGTAWPDLYGPVNMDNRQLEAERKKAERFDPYASPDLGPAFEGSRPPGYETNWSETARSRYVLPSGRAR